MNVIYEWPIWVAVVGILGLGFVASFLAHQHARRPHAEETDRSSNIITNLRTSAIGFVALMLGFSFSITSSRYNDRARLVLEEANAIGTCYLRAGLLAEPAQHRIRDALRHYTDARLANYNAGSDLREYGRTRKSMGEALDDLWAGVAQAAAADTARVRTSFIIPAANAVIDIAATHLWSDKNHMPASVLLLLAATIIITSALIGQALADSGRRHLGLWLALNVLLMLVIFVVLDFDRPRRGLILINQTPLIEQQEIMRR